MRATRASAATSPVISSRCGTTSPTVCATAGSTMGIALTMAPSPSVCATTAGMTLDHLPVRTWLISTIIEFASSVGAGSAPAERN